MEKAITEIVDLYISGKPVDADHQAKMLERFGELFAGEKYDRNMSILNLVKLNLEVWQNPFELIFQPDSTIGVVDTRLLTREEREQLQGTITQFADRIAKCSDMFFGP
jgi:hypothetical protein